MSSFRIQQTISEFMNENEQQNAIEVSKLITNQLTTTPLTPLRTPVTLDNDTGMYIFECPQCGLFTQVERNSINCAIFRHAFYYNKLPNGMVLTEQLNPHAPKEVCDQLKKEGKILGCGRPFKFVRNQDNTYSAEICDYI
jgi:hypothetical protein